jgi:hypothetical protein
MFGLLPPFPIGGPEPDLPDWRRLSPWPVIIIIVITSGWTPIQAALILSVLTTVAMLALILRWTPRQA